MQPELTVSATWDYSAEIGVVEAHRALQRGMRRRVELADGGVRSPDDVLKLMCLGADCSASVRWQW